MRVWKYGLLFVVTLSWTLWSTGWVLISNYLDLNPSLPLNSWIIWDQLHSNYWDLISLSINGRIIVPTPRIIGIINWNYINKVAVSVITIKSLHLHSYSLWVVKASLLFCQCLYAEVDIIRRWSKRSECI